MTGKITATIFLMSEGVSLQRGLYYIKLLHRHDWHYEYSDNQVVWRTGKEERDEILKMQKEIDIDFKMWNNVCPEQFKRKQYDKASSEV